VAIEAQAAAAPVVGPDQSGTFTDADNGLDGRWPRSHGATPRSQGATQSSTDATTREFNSEIVAAMLGVLAALFGLRLAFVVVVEFPNHDDARSNVET
jgi:hypothetical protein